MAVLLDINLFPRNRKKHSGARFSKVPVTYRSLVINVS